jgi:hypothetical protein
VSLGAITNDGDFLVLDDREIAILVVINLHVLHLNFAAGPFGSVWGSQTIGED